MSENKVILLFKNNVGKVYNDKITIGINKFPYEEFESIRLKKVENRKYNTIAIFFAGISLVIGLFNYSNIYFFFISLAIAFLLGLFYLIYSDKKYFLEVHLIQYQEKEIFRIKNIFKEEAKDFIKKALLINKIKKRNFQNQF